MTTSRLVPLAAAIALMFSAAAASAMCNEPTEIRGSAAFGRAHDGAATTVGFNGPAAAHEHTGSISAPAARTAGDGEPSSALGRSRWTGNVQLFW